MPKEQGMNRSRFETDIGYLGNSEEGWIAGVPGRHVPETRRGGDMSAIDTIKGRVFNIGRETFVSADEPTESGTKRKIKKAPFVLLSIGRKRE